MELAKITSKGQLTLPVSLRRKFGIETGDQLLFYECDGRIILAPVTPATLADAQEAAARQHIYTLDEIRKITVPIAERYRLKKLSLFGSYPRRLACFDWEISRTIWRTPFAKRSISLRKEC